MSGELFDQLFGVKPNWFEIKTGFDTFYVSRERVGGVRHSHMPGNAHLISILWADGNDTVIWHGMDGAVAETVLASLKDQLVIDIEEGAS
jgi:hypothetical protein